MKKVGLFVLCVFLLNNACSSSKALGDKPPVLNEFKIVPILFDDQGVLKLKLSVKLTKVGKIYNWRGHIYPLWNYGLFGEIKTRNAKGVRIEIMNKVMPLFPHPMDLIETDEYSYPEPLYLKILKENDEPYRGCLNIALIYNTEKIEHPNAKLSKLYIKSNTINVCNE